MNPLLLLITNKILFIWMNSNQKQTYCLGGLWKVNIRTKKFIKIRNGKCDICGHNKSQVFTK